MPAELRDEVERRVNGGPGLRRVFGALATRAAHVTGSWYAFALAMGVVVAWVLTGPLFGFSDTWQLVINTGTTIVTFLMVFLIQHAQNKDTRALQLKLNELIASQRGASNRLIDVEELSDEELTLLHERYQELVEDAERLKPGAQTSVEKEPGRPPGPEKHRREKERGGPSS